MRYWLGRLTPSFLIIAGWLGYEGYRLGMNRGNPWAVRAYFVGAILAFVLFVAGARFRYERRD